MKTTKLTNKLTCAVSLFSLTIFAPAVSASITMLPDISRPAGSNVLSVVDMTSTISNETDLYLVGTITWSPNASGGGVNVSWSIDFDADTNQRARVGVGTNGTTLELASGNGAGDGDGAGPATAKPAFTDVVDTTPGATTSYTFVMKVDQTAPSPGGDYWYADTVTPGAQDDAGHFLWINPNLTASEASQPTPFAGWRSGNNGYKSLMFRTNGNTGQVDFTDFAVYTGGDSPFDAVPEPSSTALLGLGGLALILRRRK